MAKAKAKKVTVKAVKKPEPELEKVAQVEAEKEPTEVPAKKTAGAKVPDQKAADDHVKTYTIPSHLEVVYVTGNGYLFYGTHHGAAKKYSMDKKCDLFTVKMK